MPPIAMSDFARYLESKRSVEDRALNRRIWARLEALLREVVRRPIAVADVGSGTGAGVERFVTWGGFEPDALEVTLVEPSPELAERARQRMKELGLRAEIETTDLAGFASRPESRARFDLVVAHAVLDILELDPALESLVGIAKPRGLLYLPITFDGETIFEPPHPSDEKVLDAYHATMRPSGDGRVGRRLYHALGRAGAEVVELGSSDWVVHPRGDHYPEDEAFFLRFLVGTVEGAISGRVPEATLARWTETRRRQIDGAELVFVAHQLDALAQKRA